MNNIFFLKTLLTIFVASDGEKVWFPSILFFRNDSIDSGGLGYEAYVQGWPPQDDGNDVPGVKP